MSGIFVVNFGGLCRGFPGGFIRALLPSKVSFSRGGNGRKGAEKRGGRGVASKGGQEGKRTPENRSDLGKFKGIPGAR